MRYKRVSQLLRAHWGEDSGEASEAEAAGSLFELCREAQLGAANGGHRSGDQA